MTPHEELRALRARAGHTQTEAARACGLLHDRTWRKWERGERRVPPHLLALYRRIVADLSG
jgi:transcriptional regulator with XRE-family HTH domain